MERSSLALQIEDSLGVRQFSLLHPVCRVGSAAECEIRLDGIADAALVLFQQEHRLFVQNRSGQRLLCGRQQLPFGQRVPWPMLHPIQLGNVVLTPMRASERAVSHDSAPAVCGDSVLKSIAGGAQRAQILLIVACLILAVPLTVRLLRPHQTRHTSLPMQECLQELGLALDQPQLQPNVRHRLQTLAQLLQRCRMAEGDGRTVQNSDRRDAIAYCQSLAAAELDSVSDFERRLARHLAFLLAEGG